MSDEVTIQRAAITGPEIDALAALAARAFRADPLAAAVFGRSPQERERRMRNLYEGALRMQSHQPITAWFEGARAAGLAGLAPADAGGLAPLRTALALPRALRGARPGELRRLFAWARSILAETSEPGDWRLGPVAVDPDARGHGIGTQLMRVACDSLDLLRAGGLVSTDIAANVQFYRRFGFEHQSTGEVLGVPVWHLRRSGRAGAAGPQCP